MNGLEILFATLARGGTFVMPGDGRIYVVDPTNAFGEPELRLLSAIGNQIRELLVELPENGGFEPCEEFIAAAVGPFCEHCGRRAFVHFWQSAGLATIGCQSFAGPAAARRCCSCSLPRAEHVSEQVYQSRRRPKRKRLPT